MERTRLAEARKQRHWTLEEAAERLECTIQSLHRWEKGIVTPHSYNIRKLCDVYGVSADDLGLEEKSFNVQDTENNAAKYLRSDLSMYLMFLTIAEYNTYWQVQDTLSKAIEEFPMDTGAEATQQRHKALQRLAMFPLLLKGQRPAEELVNVCAAGLTACGYLAISNHEDIQFAASMITTYLSLLQSITDSPKYQKAAAALIAQAFQLQSRVSYHLQGVLPAISFAEQAVNWARKSQNKIILIMAQRELLAAYEWTALQYRPQALHIAEETQHLMEAKQGPKPASMLQSWAYTGLAKYQALNRRKNEMELALERAEETFFSEQAEYVPIYIVHSHARLLRHKAISYAYLGDQTRALNIFGSIIDLKNSNFNALLPMAERTYLGVLSETMFSSLKVPREKKDKELSIALWKTVLEKATHLQSETYFNEASSAYQIIEGIWSGERDITEVRDLLVHW
ncbi:XRE family transcriptional regulator [Ktedonosporobacter rubrisoli]|uniref:XRE family transcriptional regulator n=1 Tax=Ktedonosporobacter rubrisoli TaxID=2509675 RepID=A0A4P6JJL7_KTERU|nr:helix-turn-helix transcriptional regulator [Ktedonosporobacter rubrisoli]QBD75308.1 XRE family transcriptional regulator [Ktedonosporobacter rubrisoli]